MSKRLNKFPERIFIDATYTICSGKSSGIERVVRNLIRELDQLASLGEIESPTIVASYGGKFFPVSDQSLEGFRKTAAMQSNVLANSPQLYRKAATGVCQVANSRRTRKWLLPQPGHLGVFKLLHTLRETSVFRSLAKQTPAVEARANDLFILPDAYWVNRLRHSVWPAAQEVRERGGSVASVIYDLIPLTHPEFVGLKRRDAFYEYLQKAIHSSDMLIAISQTVRDQLAAFVESNTGLTPQNTPRLESFQLGAELNSVQGNVRESVKQVFGQSKTPYLMVATFDPRKNHRFLLDTFDSLWDQNQDMSLCLVGRFGSRCDDVAERVAQHPLLNRQLHLFDDLSDAELQYCYANARGVVFPSIVEGFGLPIVESLWFGKKTFVSDTAIHREVGRKECTYFSLDSISTLANQLIDWERELSFGNPELPTRRPVTWSESCAEFLGQCLELNSNSATRFSSKAA